METHDTKESIDRGILARLETLRDEVRLKLHLASLDAKQEWDEKIEPRVLEVEQSAKEFTESSPTASKVKDLVTRLEEFLAGLRGDRGEPPRSH